MINGWSNSALILTVLCGQFPYTMRMGARSTSLPRREKSLFGGMLSMDHGQWFSMPEPTVNSVYGSWGDR